MCELDTCRTELPLDSHCPAFSTSPRLIKGETSYMMSRYGVSSNVVLPRFSTFIGKRAGLVPNPCGLSKKDVLYGCPMRGDLMRQPTRVPRNVTFAQGSECPYRRFKTSSEFPHCASVGPLLWNVGHEISHRSSEDDTASAPWRDANRPSKVQMLDQTAKSFEQKKKSGHGERVTKVICAPQKQTLSTSITTNIAIASISRLKNSFY